MPWIWTNSKPEMRRGSIPTIICGTDRSFLILFLWKKNNSLGKLIKWMTDGWWGVWLWPGSLLLGLVFCIPTGLSKKKKKVSLTQLWPKGREFSAGGQCFTCGPLFLSFDMVGLINLLQQTVWRSLQFQFMFLCHLRGQESSNPIGLPAQQQ